MFTTKLVGILRTKPDTPAKNAIKSFEVAFENGAEALEITSNSDDWEKVIKHFSQADLCVGVGSIKNKNVAKKAIDLGAKFLVSPGLFEDTVEEAAKNNIPILPGVFTKSEYKRAVDLNIKAVKFFPAGASTNFELYKSTFEPFRDEINKLIDLNWDLSIQDDKKTYYPPTKVINSPTEFYNLYKDLDDSVPLYPLVFGFDMGKKGFDRLKEASDYLTEYGVLVYAVGGINSTNMLDVYKNYNAYGVCPGSGMFDSFAILNGDYKKVKEDVLKHVQIVKDLTVSV